VKKPSTLSSCFAPFFRPHREKTEFYEGDPQTENVDGANELTSLTRQAAQQC
jgi:hypothetical protein